MKNKTNIRILLLTSLFLMQTSLVYAETNLGNQSKAEMPSDNRIAKKLGAYVGILGDPHPTLLGFNVAYNVLDYLRASVGYGSISVGDVSLTTIGAAAKFLVPGWNLSPTGTLGYSHISFDGIVADYKTSNIYLGLGGDWQASNGFNVGAGFNLSMNGGAPSAPYVNLGMFF